MEKEKLVDKVVNLLAETAADVYREEGESEEDIKIRIEKFKILREQSELEHELDSYTHNSYIGITAILNEHFKKVNELLKETTEKCKKFLDDNNLPYEEKSEDEE